MTQPSNVAIQVISAGPSGQLQTKCEDNAASGDNVMNFMTVAQSVNRSAVWQSGSTSGTADATFGGNHITVDANGNLTALGNFVGGSLSAGAGAITGGSLNVNSGTILGVLFPLQRRLFRLRGLGPSLVRCLLLG